MKNFEYLQPASIREACDLLSQYQENAKIMAGGIALITLMKQKLVAPGYVIGLEAIPNLDYITSDDGQGLKIGSMTTHRAIEKSALVADGYQVLAEVAQKVGSVQVRNVGTLGGNLCHAEPASDPPAVLMGLGAKLRLTSAKGERMVAVEDFFVDFYETVIGPEEVLTEIVIPPLPKETRSVYIKFNPRSAMDLPVVVVAAFLTPGGKKGKIKEARLALGAVGPKAIRAKQAEEVLREGELSDQAIKEAARLASQAVEPISDIRGSAEYRREVTRVLVERALNQLR